MTAIETPLHLQSAANEELQKMLKAGFIEPCHHSTDWCARSFFVMKPNSQPLKVRLVSDFRGVKKILKRPGYPMEGSSLLLKRLNPEETVFCTIDLSICQRKAETYFQSYSLKESLDFVFYLRALVRHRIYSILSRTLTSATNLDTTRTWMIF